MSTRRRARLLALLASMVAGACGHKPAPPAPAPEFSEAEVQAALHRAPGVSPDAPCRFRKLDRKPGAIAGLCAPTAGTSTSMIGPQVVLAEAHGAQLQVVAGAQLQLADTLCEMRSSDLRPGHEAPTFELDPLGYQLGKDKDSVAIGVRFTCHDEAPNGEGHETRLYLLERAGSTLNQVFDQRIGWTRVDAATQRRSSMQSAVVEQTTAHGGHFDLMLQTTTRETEVGSEPLAVQPPVKATQLLVWNGERYAPPPSSKPEAVAVAAAAFNDAELQAVLHRAPGVPAASTCKYEAWKHQPGALVALCSAPPPKPRALVGPQLVLLERLSDQWQAVASGQVTLGETHCESTSGDPVPNDEAPKFALDLAGYALASGNTAIGVRFTCHTDFPSGEGEETRLYLLERRGAVLHQVFDQPIASSNEDRAGGRETDARGVVIIESEAHADHFDLLLRTTRIDKSLGTDPAVPSTGPARAITQRFVFDGERYVAAGQ